MRTKLAGLRPFIVKPPELAVIVGGEVIKA